MTFDPRDPLRTTQQYFQLDFYQIALPQGSMSTNDEFWKPFDETFLGFTQHEVLDRSGFRVGRAPLRELPTLQRDLVDGVKKEVRGIGGSVEIPLKSGIQFQTLATYVARLGGYEMRDHDRSDNLYVLTFSQAPRAPDHVKVRLTPVVRERRLQIRAVGDKDVPYEWTQDTTSINLGIDCDLAVGECMVLAPSAVAVTNSMVIGRAFLTEERPGQLVETVIVIVPTIVSELEERAQ